MQWTASSEVMLAFTVIGLFALWTGGLHLDGLLIWAMPIFPIEIEKTIEILDDPCGSVRSIGCGVFINGEICYST